MEIQVQIGSVNDRKHIEEEISSIVGAFYQSDRNKQPRFLIPVNFDEAISILTNDTQFSSTRTSKNQLVMGKTISDQGIIVINPLLYGEHFDYQIRSTIYHHEYFHFSYERQLFSYDLSKKHGQYLSFLEFYLEEFMALQHGINATIEIFVSKTEKLEWFLNLMAQGHYENLKNRKIYHDSFIDLINNFKHKHLDLEEFLKAIFSKIRSYTLELISFTAYLSGLDASTKFEAVDDEFFNTTTRKISKILVEFSSDSLNIVDLDMYFRSFGITLNDTDEGVYWEVNFIN